MEPVRTVTTADGVVLKVGDVAFNYYDSKWGTIETEPDDSGWFLFRHNDKTASSLNGDRIAATKPSWATAR